MLAACEDNSEVMSCGFSNYMRTVCKKSYLNRQTCRQEHADPSAQQIHTGTAYNEDNDENENEDDADENDADKDDDGDEW